MKKSALILTGAILLTILLAILYIIVGTGLELFLIFMILRLCSFIDWSWWIVCIPIIAWVVSFIAVVLIRIFID